MTSEQLTSILGNIGVIFFLWMWIRSLRKQLDVQKDTLEAVKAQVSETEKISNIYRKLFDELPIEVEKWKVAILKLKDERIAELEKANQSKDDKETNAVKIEFERLISAMNALELRVSTVNQLTPPAVNYIEVAKSVVKDSSFETMMKNERTVSSLMSAYTEEDRKIALAVWRFLDAASGSVAFSEIGLKLNLDRETVGTALDRLMEKGCAIPDSDGQTETKYMALSPKQQK